MMMDIPVGGVFIPGLLLLAAMALLATIAVTRILARVGLYRLLPHRPVVEIAAFAILFCLLLSQMPSTGIPQ